MFLKVLLYNSCNSLSSCLFPEWNMLQQLKRIQILRYLPVFVMIISVSRSWNFSHRSFVSRTHSTFRRSSLLHLDRIFIRSSFDILDFFVSTFFTSRSTFSEMSTSSSMSAPSFSSSVKRRFFAKRPKHQKLNNLNHMIALSICKSKFKAIGREPGLVAMGEGSCSRGRRFVSQHQIPYGHLNMNLM